MFTEDWPSEKKLQRLRDEGEVPCSRLAVSSCVLLVVGLLVFRQRQDWGIFVEEWARLFTVLALGGRVDMEAAKAVAGATVPLIAVPAAGALVTAFLIGLLQTRFLFRFSLLRFEVSRLNPFRFPDPGTLILRVVVALVCMIFLLAAGVLCAWLAVPGVLELFTGNQQQFVLWPYQMYVRLAPFLLTGLGAAAFFAWLANRIFFLLKHRMTREELEQERREEG